MRFLEAAFLGVADGGARATCAVDHQLLTTWEELRVLAAPFSPQAAKLEIRSSEIHGRGVFASEAIAAGSKISLQWFDFVQSDGAVPSGAVVRDGMRYARGYIPTGNDLQRERLSVRAARRRCFMDSKCEGITYHDSTAAAGSVAGDDARVVVDFKATSNIISEGDGTDDWHAWVRPGVVQRQVQFFPITCGVRVFPAHLPHDLAPLGLDVCHARLVNHACNSTVDMRPTPMPDNFVVPGIPYSRGRSVRAFHAVARRDIKMGEELSVNYFTTPSYIAKPKAFVNDRAACYAAYGEPDPEADVAPASL